MLCSFCFLCFLMIVFRFVFLFYFYLLFFFFFLCYIFFYFFFFFQAEDGIRDADVTGVQTCALPILNGHSYNIIETNGVNQFNNAYTQGDLNINELILYDDRIINGNNTIGKLTIMPKSIKMTLANGTTQTITDDMQINGTACQFNTIVSATGANIAYANPNDHNRFDFVTIGGINATDADLEFDVNSGSLGNNNSQVIFLTGTPGVVGLGPDQSCVSIDPNIRSEEHTS